MSRSYYQEVRLPIPFTNKAIHVTIDGTRQMLEVVLGKREYTLSFVPLCPTCRIDEGRRGEDGGRAFWHSNAGAALLWCPKHGVLAIEQMRQGDLSNSLQMSEEQYERFVREREGDGEVED